jgi:hypothetical protein
MKDERPMLARHIYKQGKDQYLYPEVTRNKTYFVWLPLAASCPLPLRNVMLVKAKVLPTASSSVSRSIKGSRHWAMLTPFADGGCLDLVPDLAATAEIRDW